MKALTKTWAVPLITIYTICIFGGCTKSGARSITATGSIANTPILAISAPTSFRSATTTSYKQRLRLHQPKTFFAQTSNFFGYLFSPTLMAAEKDANSERGSFAQEIEELKADIGSGASGILAKIDGLYASTEHAPCFGPAWTDNATGIERSRPPYDIGLTYPTATDADGTACAAAELNALINGMPSQMNHVIRMSAAAALTSGLPTEVNQEINATEVMPPLEGVTWTQVKIKRLVDDSMGHRTYKTTLMADTIVEGQNRRITVTIRHTPLNADNTEFKGIVQAVLPHFSSAGGPNRGVSMIYNAQGGVITYLLESAANRIAASTDFFSPTTGRLDFTKTAAAEDGFKILAKFDVSDPTTLIGTMHEAWQAGLTPSPGDQATRVFEVTISGNIGTAYYGFGEDIRVLPDSTSSPWATKMHCNWLHGLGTGPSIAKLQAQTLTLNTTTGVFVPSASAINYAPKDDCSFAGNFTVSASSSSFLVGARSGANELISYGTNGFSTIPAVIAPVYPLPIE